MKKHLRRLFPEASTSHRHLHREEVRTLSSARRSRHRSKVGLLTCLFLIHFGLALAWELPLRAQTEAAQSTSPKAEPTAVTEKSESQTGSAAALALPKSSASPVVAPGDQGQYVLEFSRSPVVGNRLRLESIYDEARLRFTRPRDWKSKTTKVQLRFRHSPALYASRSNLTVLINGTSVGSVPLNQPEGKIGNAVFTVPPDLIQDYNELTIAALQNNSPTCTQDPYDPSLWSEVMPDSKIVFDFQPQPIALNFSRYPYPIFDTLSLESNQVAYLLPNQIDEGWMTGAARLQTALGRVAQYRAMDTRVLETLEQVKQNERLLVIGTPATQPSIATLNLPFSIKGNQILDAKQKPLPADSGVLMLTTTANDRVPVLVATGNSEAGVAKAVQFLVQSHDQQIGTGNAIVVNQLMTVAPPPVREWQGYLPQADQFQLHDLKTYNDSPYQDVTVRGSHAPAMEWDFKALPDDRLLPGSFMTLDYSYGPQVNPLTSLVEVQLDGVPIVGKRLTSVNGASHESLRVDLPPDAVKPNSRMQVNFRLDPREQRSCSRVTDQQLWGTVHADTHFELKREHVARIPDLKLLQSGYPFAAPQDLSNTAIVLPNQPDPATLLLLLETSERLGRMSKADSVQLAVYRSSKLPQDQRQQRNLIGIGTQAQFPFPEVYKTEGGFALQKLFSRQWRESQVQTLPDSEGVVKTILSPWNRDRVLLALTAQTNSGLDQVRDLISQDSLFFQIEGDTVLVSANKSDPSPYNANDYTLEFLRQSPQRELSTTGTGDRLLRLLRNNWFILVPGLVAAALMLYGVTQLYLKKFTGQER